MRSVLSNLNMQAPFGDIGISFTGSSYYVADDLVWCADHGIGLGPLQPREVRLSANGTSNQLSTASTAGITGALVDGSDARVVVAVDPVDVSKTCWLTRVNSADADTDGTGAKRSEMSMRSPLVLRQGRRYLVGLCQRLGDWTNTADEQLTWQIPGADALGMSPWIAHYVQGNTRRIGYRYDTSPVPSSETATIGVVWAESGWTPMVWERWIIEVVESASTGMVRAYKNGILVGAYDGPLGYTEPNGYGSYWKQGVYHWTNAGNTWDASLPTREVWTKGAFISENATLSEMDSLLSTL